MMILHRYFAWRYVKSYLGVAAGFFVILALIDTVEQLRRFGGRANFVEIAQLTLLNSAPTLYMILPLMVMMSSLLLFLGLARSSELVVARAAGRSAIIAMLGPIAMVSLLGVLSIVIFNPIVASTTKAYEARTDALQGVAQIELSGSALWWRQGDATGQTVIRAEGTNHDGTLLRNPLFVRFSPDGAPLERIEADSAELHNGGWHMVNATRWPLDPLANPEAEKEHLDHLTLASSMTLDEVRNSFGRPDTISVWELPALIERLQTAGFSALRYQVHLHNTLSMPLFLIAMMLIAAMFTLRHQRGGRTGVMVLWAVLLSFSLYFVRNLAQILGENGQIPVWLAAWATPIAAIALALGWLLHLEDG